MQQYYSWKIYSSSYSWVLQLAFQPILESHLVCNACLSNFMHFRLHSTDADSNEIITDLYQSCYTTKIALQLLHPIAIANENCITIVHFIIFHSSIHYSNGVQSTVVFIMYSSYTFQYVPSPSNHIITSLLHKHW